MNFGFEGDLNVEVEIESESEGITFAAALILLNSIAGDAAQNPCRRIHKATCCLLDVAEREVVERASLPPLIASSPLRGLVLLRFFALRLVRLFLAAGLLVV